ncbi:MAG: DNA gyrase subunit A [Ignavibacteria bacterium GWA2_55_11]|nr:MAG: DNA gyrase subunit A [Ignavibacteria bacterium GWA2_55_11]OGU44747.1 MAG: DNA gyrase subunit A [Ignavibacteria bacterium GWC2_56_12]OGU64552.1 MAG: DNA gyrase subunit A [Ignavibacteria bacterium RIFCSPHIGHO2_02_FULL_56_12]OGU75096.1 MAG: DNA gyrase subunit A [Ignavibacteria bacterium RIFCSPLOWO2_02_FULL_55_14]
MATVNEKIIPVDIEDEMRGSYIDYSMSVIVARALPDVRDGLKPVHRRVLYGMQDLGLASNRAYKKSARIVGEVLGKYHPHGDIPVYDTLVRLAQDFSMRYRLVDGQGNFGSVDGDSPAAMRYTEARLTRIAEEMLRDLDKDTVKFVPNFDDTLKEPSVLPALIPNLLCNGSSGIAVGMTTNIPPHNLREVVDGCIAYMKDNSISNEKLMKHITAPDFPTGGIIYGYEGVKEAYTKGRGRIIVRAKAAIETAKGDRQRIIVNELPYQVNKASLIEKIADLVTDKKIDDISNINDESDRDGMRVVIELKRDANAEIVLNNLYKHTQMQTTFGVIMLALVDGRPQVLTLKDILRHFVEHRNNVIVRRTKFELDEAEKKAHILEGYIIALDNIDAVIKLIKASKDVEDAKNGLMKKFKLSEIQAKAILDMRLQKLTGLERQKVEDEYKVTIKLIERLKAILKSKALQLQMIEQELTELKGKFGDDRRTEIVYKAEEFSIEDMIAEEDVVITISHSGLVKRTPVSGYRRQGRGGRGVTGAGTREDDFMEHMFVASTHDYILIFTDKGRCYWLKVFEVPEGGRTSKGKSISSLIGKTPEETIASFIAVKSFDDKHFVLMVSREGMIKKVLLSEFSNPRRGGITAANMKGNDAMTDVKLVDGKHDVIIGTANGMAIRFHEEEIRPMGRSAAGVRGIRLGKGDKVVGAVTLHRKGTSILVATEKGFGKRSEEDEYRVSHRGGKGIKTVKVTDKTGRMVAIREVLNTDDIVVVTKDGIIIRQHASEVRMAGRNTQGVRLIRLQENDVVADVAVVIAEEEEEKKIAAESDKLGNGKEGGEKGGDGKNSKQKPAPPREKKKNTKTQRTRRKKG